MGQINTEFLQKCIDTLRKSYVMINSAKEGTIDYEMYRNSLVKSFEITLEQSGKLLKKKLIPYFATKKAIDTLSFKDIFRYAHKHSLLDEKTVERWFQYRDNRNNTAHDYGIKFAQKTLTLVENFLADVEKLKIVIEND